MKLEQEHSLLLSKLVELGGAECVSSATSSLSPPPPGTTPTEIACPMEGLLGQSDRHLHEIFPASKEMVFLESTEGGGGGGGGGGGFFLFFFFKTLFFFLN